MPAVVVRSTASGLQETRWDGLWLAVTLSVCVTDIDAGCVTEYTLFVCGLASFDCIMYSKTSDKPLEMASNGTGQSTNEPVIWYQRSRGMSAVLFTLLIQYSHFTMFDLLLFFLLDPSSHLPPELPTDRRTQEQANKQKYLRDKWAASVISALEMKRIECKDTSSV